MSEKRNKPRGLGRGLSALMADVAPTETAPEEGGQRRADLTVPVEKIFPKSQPSF